MPDYDVSAVALASPPTSAPVTDYRPGIAVKNLGIHDADVTGYLNVYDRATGLLVATFSLAADDIAPGETRTASASTLWQPTEADVGKHFLFTGYINYPPDQNLANNQLQPVDVLVTAEEPPPPPPVEAHASQHEDGGSDELTVEGLTGKLAEAQEPIDHAARHGAEGEDQLDVTDLTGLLATPQTPATHAVTHGIGGSDPVTGIAPGPHATTHSPEGGDEINVDGLPGVLAEPQPPQLHGSSTHEAGQEDEFSVAGLSGQLATTQVPINHGSSYHDATVEATANKDQDNGYLGLSASGLYGAARCSDSLSIGIMERDFADQTLTAGAGAVQLDTFGFDIIAGAAAGARLYASLDAEILNNKRIDVTFYVTVTISGHAHTSRALRIYCDATGGDIHRIIPCAMDWSDPRQDAGFATIAIYARNDGDNDATVTLGHWRVSTLRWGLVP